VFLSFENVNIHHINICSTGITRSGFYVSYYASFLEMYWSWSLVLSTWSCTWVLVSLSLGWHCLVNITDLQQ